MDPCINFYFMLTVRSISTELQQMEIPSLISISKNFRATNKTAFFSVLLLAMHGWTGPRWSINFRPKEVPSCCGELRDQPSMKLYFYCLHNMLGISFDNDYSGPDCTIINMWQLMCPFFLPFCTYMKILVIMELNGMTAKYQTTKTKTFCRLMGWVKHDR